MGISYLILLISLQAEQAAKKKKSALSHSMMKELKSQMFDTPEEISHEADTRYIFLNFTDDQVAVFRKQKYIQEEKEKAMYEEDMFTRLPVSKAEKQARRQVCRAPTTLNIWFHPVINIFLTISDEHHWQSGEKPDQLWIVQL